MTRYKPGNTIPPVPRCNVTVPAKTTNNQHATLSHQLYRHYDADGVLLYVGISVNACGRLAQHKSGARWFSKISLIRIEHFPTQASARAAEVEAIQSEKPLFNSRRNQRKPRSPYGPNHVLRTYLSSNGISQLALAKKVGVSQGLVSSWLFGVNSISPRIAERLERAIGIPRLALLYPDEHPPT